MKVITLKQPWASLIAHGYKKYEFRSWKTNYRGPVLIHAGKGIDKNAMKNVSKYDLEFPSSKIIAMVEIIDCVKLDDQLNNKLCSENRDVYGYSKHDGYVWILSNPRIIKIDENINGKLGFWNYELNIINDENKKI